MSFEFCVEMSGKLGHGLNALTRRVRNIGCFFANNNAKYFNGGKELFLSRNVKITHEQEYLCQIYLVQSSDFGQKWTDKM